MAHFDESGSGALRNRLCESIRSISRLADLRLHAVAIWHMGEFVPADSDISPPRGGRADSNQVEPIVSWPGSAFAAENRLDRSVDGIVGAWRGHGLLQDAGIPSAAVTSSANAEMGHNSTNSNNESDEPGGNAQAVAR